MIEIKKKRIAWNKGLTKDDDRVKQERYPKGTFLSNKGYKWTKEQREKLSNSMKGKKPWNFGLTIEDERVRKGSEKQSITLRESFKTGRIINSHKNKTWEEEYGNERANEMKKESHDKRVGKRTWNKESHPETCKKISENRTGIKLSETHRKNIGLSKKGKKHPSMSVESRLKSSMSNKKTRTHEWWVKYFRKLNWKDTPNSQEQVVLGIIQKNKLSYKYTGNFSFMIDGCAPDFTNTNGQKKVIEFFGERWHKEDDEEKRRKRFAKFGYITLIIWGKELEDLKKVEKKILDFDKQQTLDI